MDGTPSEDRGPESGSDSAAGPFPPDGKRAARRASRRKAGRSRAAKPNAPDTASRPSSACTASSPPPSRCDTAAVAAVATASGLPSSATSDDERRAAIPPDADAKDRGARGEPEPEPTTAPAPAPEGPENVYGVPPVLVAYVLYDERGSVSGGQALSMLVRLEGRMITPLLRPREHVPTNDEARPGRPHVYASVGGSADAFPGLLALPERERMRWIHFASFAAVMPEKIYTCWLNATDPLPVPREVPPSRFSCSAPLVSVFTSAFRSGEKVRRPFVSLVAQSYRDWEWVIVDDSDDDGATYARDLAPIAAADSRVRVYRQHERTGYIGGAKRWAAGLCVGEILVEVDHDDLLTPDCLQRIVDAFRRHPECGFAYCDSAELHVGTHLENWFGWDFGFGYGVCWREWVPQIGRWLNALRTPDLNRVTACHLIGLPNHPRAWTRDCYHLVGGHRPELSVSDDYDILARTLMCTRWVRVPHLTYLQYINAGGDNQTSRRNLAIQVLCQELYRAYEGRIQARMDALGMPRIENTFERIWDAPRRSPRRVAAQVTDVHPRRECLCFAVPLRRPPAGERDRLMRALDACAAGGWDPAGPEIVVVGDVPAEVEARAATAPPGRVRWWPMDPTARLKECVRYAELLGSGGPVRWSFRSPWTRVSSDDVRGRTRVPPSQAVRPDAVPEVATGSPVVPDADGGAAEDAVGEANTRDEVTISEDDLGTRAGEAVVVPC